MIDTVIFDRDGVINEVVMRGNVVSSPRSMGEFHIRDEFRRLFADLEARGVKAFVVSNQPDVRRGSLNQGDLTAMTDRLKSEFNFGEVVYCVHDDEDQCLCRKPKPGMIEHLIMSHHLDRDRCILVGDSHKDILAARAAGVRSILLRCSYNLYHKCDPDFTVDALQGVTAILEASQDSVS